MNIPNGAESYATEASGNLLQDLKNLNGSDDESKWLISEHLLRAYRAGHRKGLEEGYKTKWVVVRKMKCAPLSPGERFEGGLDYPVALEVVKTANRVRSSFDVFYDIEPE